MTRLIVIAAICGSLMVSPAEAGKLGPMNIRLLNLFRDAAQQEGEPNWAAFAYDNYLTGLFEATLMANHEKPQFCLPAEFTTGNISDVFGRLRAEFDAAINQADLDASPANLFLRHLYRLFPCSR